MTVELLSRTADDDVIIRLFRVQNITRVGGRAFTLKIQLTEWHHAASWRLTRLRVSVFWGISVRLRLSPAHMLAW